MGTVRVVLTADLALPLPSVAFPEYKQAGTNIAVASYSFDAGATEGIQFVLPYVGSYGSGNLTCKLRWYADTATTGSVVWGASIACITPETDTQDIETDAWATENTVTDAHLGTTAQRLHEASITISNLDSIAAGDYLSLRIQRLGTNGSDTLSGDAQLVGVVLEYSDA